MSRERSDRRRGRVAFALALLVLGVAFAGAPAVVAGSPDGPTAGSAPVAASAGSLQSLSVSLDAPETATVGESTTVGTSVAVADLAGEYESDATVDLVVDGTVVDSRTVTVQDGETTSVEFSHAFSETGSHDVRVEASTSMAGETLSGSATDTVEVDPEPVGSLNLSADVPSTATAGEETGVSATVSLPEAAGQDASGGVTVELAVDGQSRDSRTVTLSDGESRTVSLSTTFQGSGDRTVTVAASGEVGGESVSASLQRSVTVESAGATLPDLELDADVPATATVGEETQVTTTVSLPAIEGRDVSGDVTLELVADGQSRDSETVTLSDGESTSATLSTTFSTAGEVTVVVEASGDVGGESLSAAVQESLTVEPAGSRDLDVSADVPGSATVGEEAQVTTTVSLPAIEGADVSTDVTVAVAVDGERRDTETVTLSDGESRTVALSATFQEAGVRTVLVGALTTVGGQELAASVERTVTVEGSGPGSPEIQLGVQAPEAVPVGEQAEFAATVALPSVPDSSADAEVTVTVRANGERKASRTVAVGSEERSVPLSVTFDEAGRTMVTVEATATVGGETVSRSIQGAIRVAAAGDLRLRTDLPSSPSPGDPVSVPVEVAIPEAPADSTGEVSVTLLVDGTEVASGSVTLSGGNFSGTTLEHAFEPGTHTVTVVARAAVGNRSIERRVSGTVEVPERNATTVAGAAFAVPESLEDEVAEVRGSVELPGDRSAFVLADRSELYLVFTGADPQKGLANVTGRLVGERTVGNHTVGVVVASDATFTREGTPATVRAVANDSADYRLDLVRIDATYRRVTTLTDPDEGADFTMSTTSGVLVSDPRSIPGAFEEVGATARRLVRDPGAGQVDRALDDPRGPHLHTVSFETRFWLDARATVDAVVLDPGSAAYEFVREVDAAGVAHAEAGEPILYKVQANMAPQSVEGVEEVKRNADDLDGTVVSFEANVYQQRISVQETLEHATTEVCTEDRLRVDTPEGPVCVNVVQDVLLHAGAAWNGVPAEREDVLVLFGASSRHQDSPTAVETGTYRVVGEVVDTSRIDESLPDGTALLVYRLSRTGDVDYGELGEEARAIVENRTARLRDELREGIRNESGADAPGGDGPGVARTIETVRAGDPATVEFPDEATAEAGIRNVTVETAATVSGVTVRAAAVESRPDSVPEPPTDPERIVNVSASGVADSDLDRVTFRLELAADRVPADATVVAYRFHDGAWGSIDASVVARSGSAVVVEVTTPGLSYFAVGVEASDGTTTTTTDGDGETTTTARDDGGTGDTTTDGGTGATTTDGSAGGGTTSGATTSTDGTTGSDGTPAGGSGTDGSADGGDGGAPGFGVAVAALAVVLSTLFARRRR